MKGRTGFRAWLTGSLFIIVLNIVFLISWVTNLIQFINCDFDAPYKEEVVHAVGIFIPYAAIVTTWY